MADFLVCHAEVQVRRTHFNVVEKTFKLLRKRTSLQYTLKTVCSNNHKKSKELCHFLLLFENHELKLFKTSCKRVNQAFTVEKTFKLLRKRTSLQYTLKTVCSNNHKKSKELCHFLLLFENHELKLFKTSCKRVNQAFTFSLSKINYAKRKFRRSTREFHVITGKPFSGNTIFMHNEAVHGIWQ